MINLIENVFLLCLEDDEMNRKTKLSERILSLLLVFAIVLPMIPLEFLR